MADPKKMIRVDGTKVVTLRQPSWKVELFSLWVAVRTDPLILLLFPMFFASNYFYTWQFNAYNGALFNIRTRSVNDLVYWSSQILGSLSIGLLLDYQKLSRRTRAFVGWTVLFGMVFFINIWAFFYQRTYTRDSTSAVDAIKIDLGDSAYPAHVVLYVFFGITDAIWQTAAYWMMGAMSNDPAKLAYFTGFYKSIQSAGAVGAFAADGNKVPYMNLFLSTWVICVAGLLFMLPMIYLRVKEHTDFDDEPLARMGDTRRIEQEPQATDVSH